VKTEYALNNLTARSGMAGSFSFIAMAGLGFLKYRDTQYEYYNPHGQEDEE
jgi:hypothetical protein